VHGPMRISYVCKHTILMAQTHSFTAFRHLLSIRATLHFNKCKTERTYVCKHTLLMARTDTFIRCIQTCIINQISFCLLCRELLLHVRHWARQAADACANARNRQNLAAFDWLLATALITAQGPMHICYS
jgi:hypothetical protein